MWEQSLTEVSLYINHSHHIIPDEPIATRLWEKRPVEFFNHARQKISLVPCLYISYDMSRDPDLQPPTLEVDVLPRELSRWLSNFIFEVLCTGRHLSISSL